MHSIRISAAALRPLAPALLAAFVVAPQLTAAELRQALRLRVDAAFLPRPLVFVDALPRTVSGKVQKFRLRAPYWDPAEAI